MTGSRRILAICIVLGLVVPGSSVTFNADPALGQNAVDRFFGRIGDALRGNRSRKNQPDAARSDPARRGAHFNVDTRKQIQVRLNDLGHYDGAADGIFGSGTQRGISEYQRAIGDRPTGILTPDQANRLLAVAPPAADTTTDIATEEPAGQQFVPPSGAVADPSVIADSDAVWNSLAIRACEAEELLDCMARFGAPKEAVDFVKTVAGTEIEAGPLVHFEDFGRVDMGEIGYPWKEQKSALVLLNGGPPGMSVETAKLPAITIDGPAYRKLLDQHRDLSLVGRPVFRSHRLTSENGQRFVFGYRLATCEGCQTPGEVLIGYDFNADGRYSGAALLGVWAREPGAPWPGAAQYSVDDLMGDDAAVRRRLANLGFDAGDAEAAGENRLRVALASFQSDHGLSGGGELNSRTAILLATPDFGIEIDRFDRIYRSAEDPDLFDLALRTGISLLARAERSAEIGDVALARLNSRVARLYLRKKEPHNALPYAEMAVSTSAEAYRQPNQIHGLYLVSLGETYLALDEKEKAVAKYTEALDIFQDLTVTDSPSRRDLAVKSFMRTGQKLIGLHDQLDNDLARETIEQRLEAVEQDMASAQ